jgi:hypothetical protein
MRQPAALASGKKRAFSPNDLITSRVIQVPISMIPSRVQDYLTMTGEIEDYYTDLEASKHMQ